MAEILNEIREELLANSDEQTKKVSQHFFKEAINCYGIKSATVGKISKAYFKRISDLSKADVFALCGELWRSGFMEESIIACEWSYYVHKKYEKEDLKVFENWIDHYITNWATCDTLCNHTVGEFLEMYPESITELKRWALSANRWKRRAAAVSLIIPARHGLFLADILEIATQLLTDPDDMVQKGYGWMLKVASQRHEQQIFNFVFSNKSVMPRTALRYAIEKMAPDLKVKAMSK